MSCPTCAENGCKRRFLDHKYDKCPICACTATFDSFIKKERYSWPTTKVLLNGIFIALGEINTWWLTMTGFFTSALAGYVIDKNSNLFYTLAAVSIALAILLGKFSDFRASRLISDSERRTNARLQEIEKRLGTEEPK